MADTPHDHEPWKARIFDGIAFGKLVARFYKFDEEEADEERFLFKAAPEYKKDAAAERPPDAERKTGRIDVFMWLDPEHTDAMIIEAKWTDWDAIKARDNVEPNIESHAAQVSSYLGGTIEAERGKTGERVELTNITLQSGLVYPSVPTTPGLREEIEEALAQECISVVWFDEPPAEGSPAGKAWWALQRGELVSNDLAGSPEWVAYLDRIRRM